MDKLTVPDRWGECVVHAEVECRACGYVLRGLRGRGKCPECGTDVWGSILKAVDPIAQGLPRLANPRKVGNGLVIMTLCLFISGLLVAFTTLGAVAPGSWGWYWSLNQFLLSGGGGFAGVFGHGALMIAAIWAGAMLWPRAQSGIRAGRRDILLLIGGLMGWGTAVGLIWGCDASVLGGRGSIWWELVELGGVFGAGLVLLGLRGVLGVIGQRSYAYRDSLAGRQSLGAMLAALVAGLMGELAVEITHYLPQNTISRQMAGRLEAIGAVVIWVCIAMLLIGLAYLVMNAWWVRQAINRPHRTLEDILHMPTSDETVLGEDETRFAVSMKERGISGNERKSDQSHDG